MNHQDIRTELLSVQEQLRSTIDQLRTIQRAQGEAPATQASTKRTIAALAQTLNEIAAQLAGKPDRYGRYSHNLR